MTVSGGWHGGAGDQVVGDVEQAADERLVAGDDLGAVGVRVGGRLLHHEAALGAGGHDHRVLHHLRLHQAEHLGAEVLAPVAPADPAAGDRAAAEVHALDPGPAHPDLVGRPRQRQLRDGGRIELEGERRTVAVVVGAHRRRDQGEEAPADAVVVEAGDGVERLADRRRQRGRRGGAAIGRTGGVEAGGEQLDEVARQAGVLGERRLDVRLAEGEADLAQVLGVGAQHRHLAGVEAGEQHETVEPVALDHALDETGERLLQSRPAGLVEHRPRRATRTPMSYR